jgi:excisionase family DNA binding protein
MSTVERLLRQWALPVVKVGRKVLVRRSAVEFWLAAQEIPIYFRFYLRHWRFCGRIPRYTITSGLDFRPSLPVPALLGNPYP